MPNLVTDGAAFFPNVLRDANFIKYGYLSGNNPGGDPSGFLHGQVIWTVVDPARHILSVWEKKDPLFPVSGAKLGATVWTNGSFNVYKAGNSKASRAAAWLMVNVYAPVANAFFSLFGGNANVVSGTKSALYTSEESEGFVISSTNGISQVLPAESRPLLHHFGRQAGGRQFANYAVASGDPPLSGEWIGGLFRTVSNYTFGEPDQLSNTWGIWGLAPLASGSGNATLDSAINAYEAGQPHAETHKETAGGADTGAGVGPPASPFAGLIITAFFSGTLKSFASILIAALVRDAARIDGSDSIVMGVMIPGGGGVQGVYDAETEKKKLYNRWGYQCRAG